MTEVVEAGADTGLDTEAVGRPRHDAAEPHLVDEELADRLPAQAVEPGVELLGEGGPLKQMTKAILERSLQVENRPLGLAAGRPRRGRDRQQPQRHNAQALGDRGRPCRFGGPSRSSGHLRAQRRLDGVDKLVMGLYVRGMSVRDIQTPAEGDPRPPVVLLALVVGLFPPILTMRAFERAADERDLARDVAAEPPTALAIHMHSRQWHAKMNCADTRRSGTGLV